MGAASYSFVNEYIHNFGAGPGNPTVSGQTSDLIACSNQPVLTYPLLSESELEELIEQNSGSPLKLAELQYYEVQVEQFDQPIKVMKDNGAEISLVKTDLIKDLGHYLNPSCYW